MPLSFEAAFLIGATFVAYGAIAVWDFFAVEDIDDFFLAGRSLWEGNFIANAVVTNYSFLTLVFVLSFWGYSYGSGAWWPIVTAVVGFFLFAWSKISLTGQDSFLRQGDTIHEFLGIRYGAEWLRPLASVPTAFAFLGYFISSIYLAAQYFGSLVGVGTWWVVLAVAGISVIYTALGGFMSVAKTDVLQFLLILVGTLVVFYTIGTANVSADVLTEQLFELDSFIRPDRGISYVLGLFVINGLWQFAAMDMWQRSLAVGDAKKVQRGALIAGLVFGIIAIPAILLGLLVGNVTSGGPLNNPTAVITAFTDSIPGVWWNGAFLTALVGALLSSQDSNLAALTQTLYVDVWKEYRDDNSTNSAVDSLSQARILVAVSAVFGLIILYILTAKIGFDLISFLLTFFSAQVALLPSIFFALTSTRDFEPTIPAISISFGFIIAFALGLYSVAHPAWQFWTPLVGLTAAAIPFVWKFVNYLYSPGNVKSLL